MARTQLFLAGIIALIIGCTSSQKTQRSPAALSNKTEFQSLFQMGSVDLDRFTESFFSELTKNKPPKNLKNSIVKLYNTPGSNVHMLFNEILKSSQNYGDKNAGPYFEIAEALFSARLAIRNDTALTRTEFKLQSMYLLQTLGEETLYVIALKFPTQKSWAKTYLSKQKTESQCQDIHKKRRTKDLLDPKLTVCQGDIMLTKGGQLSSSLLSRVTDYPGNFSHAALVYIEPQNPIVGKSGQLFSPESYIEDGVKLRKPDDNHYFGHNSKLKRFAVYRHKTNQSVHPEIIRATDEFIENMKSSGVSNIQTETVYPYDFDFNPKERSAYFCSEVPYSIYERAQKMNTRVTNAYEESLWGEVTGSTKLLFQNFLNIDQTRFPSPSDLETNPAFDLVGFKYNISMLAKDRVDVAAVDTLILLTQNDEMLMESYTRLFTDIANDKIDLNKAVNDLEQKGIITSATSIAIRSKFGGQLPNGINLKQMLFFGYLNEVLGPKVRSKFSKYFEPQSAADRIGLNQLRTEMLQFVLSEIQKLKEATDSVK